MIAFLFRLASAVAPAGWSVTGEGYALHTDDDAREGARSLVLDGQRARGSYGTVVQVIAADRYVGKRLRMSVWLRCEDVTDWAGAWLRVDRGTKAVAFDNMQRRALTETQPWSQQTIVLDVPTGATTIWFGGVLAGRGQLWMDDVRLDVVDASVPVTDLMVERTPDRPVNLDFE